MTDTKPLPAPSHAPKHDPEPPLPLPHVWHIHSRQTLHWLYLGLKDMCHAPWLSLLHGLVIALCGGLITGLANDRFWLLAGAVSGFLVVAPVMATSLYAMSRAIEKKEAVNLALLRNTWTRWQLQRKQEPVSYWCLVRFGVLLGLAGTTWVLTSSALITLWAPLPVNTPMDFIRHVVLSSDSYLFEVWLILGGLMAAPVFASSVVSMPLLLDREVTTLQAILTSWKVVLTHPVPMAFWSFLIMGLCLLGFLTLFMGFLFIGPLLGHASWHAYKDLVDTRGFTERCPPVESL